MRFSFYIDDIGQLATDVVGLLCFEDKLGEGALFQALDKALGGLLTSLTEAERFRGKKGQTLSVHTHGKVSPARVLLVGGGARTDFQPPN